MLWTGLHELHHLGTHRSHGSTNQEVQRLTHSELIGYKVFIHRVA